MDLEQDEGLQQGKELIDRARQSWSDVSNGIAQHLHLIKQDAAAHHPLDHVLVKLDRFYPAGFFLVKDSEIQFCRNQVEVQGEGWFVDGHNQTLDVARFLYLGQEVMHLQLKSSELKYPITIFSVDQEMTAAMLQGFFEELYPDDQPEGFRLLRSRDIELHTKLGDMVGNKAKIPVNNYHGDKIFSSAFELIAHEGNGVILIHNTSLW